jgi:hypothetical protein
MTTHHENDTEVKEVARTLAYMGIVALYGGSKGHGYWLTKLQYSYLALAFFNNPRDNLGFTGESLTNDGKKSGNPHFWTFEDAQALALALTTDIHAFPYPRMEYAQANGSGWIETDEAGYMDALEVLPPRRWQGNAFFVGECHSYDYDKRDEVYAAFTSVNKRFFARYATLRDFNPAAYESEIRAQFAIE